MFNYGLQIKKLMESKGFKQVELAKKLGVTPGFVNQIILGRRQPGRKTLFRVAEALEIHVEELLPMEVKGGVPLLFDMNTSRFHVEYAPEQWDTTDMKPKLIPVPTGYTFKAAEREKIFAIRIDTDRFYPVFRRGMIVYLKPFKHIENRIYSVLCLYRNTEGFCTFEEVEKTDDMYLLKDLVTHNTVVYKTADEIPGRLYQVISIVIGE